MKVYWTNAALGHQQSAYLIRLSEVADKNNEKEYLCIEVSGFDPEDSDSYKVGETTKLFDSEVEECENYNLSDSPLYTVLTKLCFYTEQDMEAAFEAGAKSERESVQGNIEQGIIGTDGIYFSDWIVKYNNGNI